MSEIMYEKYQQWGGGLGDKGDISYPAALPGWKYSSHTLLDKSTKGAATAELSGSEVSVHWWYNPGGGTEYTLTVYGENINALALTLEVPCGTLPASEFMTALGRSFCLVHGQTLYQCSGGEVRIGEKGDWPNVKAMAALGDSLYIIANTELWRTGPKGGAVQIGPNGDWPGVKAMTAMDDSLYIIANNDELWRTGPNGGATQIGPAGDWPGVRAMAASGGSLYIIANSSELWRTGPGGGATKMRGLEPWSGTSSLVAVGNDLFLCKDGTRLWKLTPPEGSEFLGYMPSTRNGEQLSATAMASRDGGLFLCTKDWIYKYPGGGPSLLLGLDNGVEPQA